MRSVSVHFEGFTVRTLRGIVLVFYYYQFIARNDLLRLLNIHKYTVKGLIHGKMKGSSCQDLLVRHVQGVFYYHFQLRGLNNFESIFLGYYFLGSFQQFAVNCLLYISVHSENRYCQRKSSSRPNRDAKEYNQKTLDSFLDWVAQLQFRIFLMLHLSVERQYLLVQRFDSMTFWFSTFQH